ncbi:hypothetical protein HAX54_050027 [Datura stramonium]|uniref:Uncharacterized protein n=1 Tax=Datura stramonium TaxID=4076 RepID=A0ABS8WPT4_DATST|nr:hypothetical protein [Datura stramonium]
MHEVLRSTFNSPVEIPREEQLAGLLSSTRDILINQTSQRLLELEGDLRHNLNVADPRIRFRTQSNAQRSGRIFYYLGAYFLQLSRTMMQVEMGGRRRTATVNVGPSFYIIDDLRPNPLSIQGEGYTFVLPRQINILYNLYLAELHQRQISNRSSFPTKSFQNMSSQLQHEQDSAIIRQ